MKYYSEDGKWMADVQPGKTLNPVGDLTSWNLQWRAVSLSTLLRRDRLYYVQPTDGQDTQYDSLRPSSDGVIRIYQWLDLDDTDSGNEKWVLRHVIRGSSSYTGFAFGFAKPRLLDDTYFYFTSQTNQTFSRDRRTVLTAVKLETSTIIDNAKNPFLFKNFSSVVLSLNTNTQINVENVYFDSTGLRLYATFTESRTFKRTAYTVSAGINISNRTGVTERTNYRNEDEYKQINTTRTSVVANVVEITRKSIKSIPPKRRSYEPAHQDRVYTINANNEESLVESYEKRGMLHELTLVQAPTVITTLPRYFAGIIKPLPSTLTRAVYSDTAGKILIGTLTIEEKKRVWERADFKNSNQTRVFNGDKYTEVYSAPNPVPGLSRVSNNLAQFAIYRPNEIVDGRPQNSTVVFDSFDSRWQIYKGVLQHIHEPFERGDITVDYRAFSKVLDYVPITLFWSRNTIKSVHTKDLLKYREDEDWLKKATINSAYELFDNNNIPLLLNLLGRRGGGQRSFQFESITPSLFAYPNLRDYGLIEFSLKFEPINQTPMAKNLQINLVKNSNKDYIGGTVDYDALMDSNNKYFLQFKNKSFNAFSSKSDYVYYDILVSPRYIFNNTLPVNRRKEDLLNVKNEDVIYITNKDSDEYKDIEVAPKFYRHLTTSSNLPIIMTTYKKNAEIFLLRPLHKSESSRLSYHAKDVSVLGWSPWIADRVISGVYSSEEADAERKKQEPIGPLALHYFERALGGLRTQGAPTYQKLNTDEFNKWLLEFLPNTINDILGNKIFDANNPEIHKTRKLTDVQINNLALNANAYESDILSGIQTYNTEYKYERLSNGRYRMFIRQKLSVRISFDQPRPHNEFDIFTTEKFRPDNAEDRKNYMLFKNTKARSRFHYLDINDPYDYPSAKDIGKQSIYIRVGEVLGTSHPMAKLSETHNQDEIVSAAIASRAVGEHDVFYVFLGIMPAKKIMVYKYETSTGYDFDNDRWILIDEIEDLDIQDLENIQARQNGLILLTGTGKVYGLNDPVNNIVPDFK